MRIIAATIMNLLLLPAAYAVDYKINVPHTQVYFSVNHMGFSNSTGLLSVQDGSFSFDEKDWGKSKLDVTLGVASLQMGDKTWNEHLSGAKFFNVAKFPTIRFVSTKVEKSTDTTGKVSGTLTLLGVSKPVSFAITKNKVGQNPMMEVQYAGFSGTGSLKRSDFGMNANVGPIGDDVSFRIEVEAAAATPEMKK
jgi:polyisoprenoid-binding protein YceI